MAAPKSPSEVLRIWFDRLWIAGDESVIDELYAETAIAHGLPTAPVAGPEGFKQVYRAFRQAFPNMRIEVTHTVSEGDFGVVHCRVIGTNTGPLMGGVEPTNRPVDFSGMTMARVVDGRIQEGWNVYDFLAMYQQLGVEPPQPV
jgi:predicted ester cyclase